MILGITIDPKHILDDTITMRAAVAGDDSDGRSEDAAGAGGER